jgi:hypothetical protein
MDNLKRKTVWSCIKITDMFNRIKKRFAQVAMNEKGEGILPLIIFVAIVILAVLATQPTVRDAFNDAVTKFRTWLNSKLDTLFA